jgi:predicted transcriptional regulator of viral defense system
MNSKKINLVKSLFKNEIPLINTAILKQNGIHSRNIAELIDKGFISRIKQGYYMWNQRADDTSEIALATRLIPNGVLCLYTAIEYHGLSTINPAEIFFALPRGTVAPLLPLNLKVNVRQMIDKHFKLGKSEEELDGLSIKIYDIEKTVCDCFKYDREIEKSIALEVLKNYMTRKNCNVQKLLEYAQIMGKKKIILPYVEAIL